MNDLVGFGVIRGLGILSLFDVLYHLPEEGMTVVLILHHQHLQHKPQAPTPTHTHRHTVNFIKTSHAYLKQQSEAVYMHKP